MLETATNQTVQERKTLGMENATKMQYYPYVLFGIGITLTKG